jgi:HlyD family secretion protein
MLSKSSRVWWPFVGLVIGLGLWSAKALSPSPHVEVVTASISDGRIVRRVVAAGTLQAVTTVQVGAQVSGTIQSLDADFNSIVQRGQVLARLEPALFQAALDEAQGALGRAQAAAVQAQAVPRSDLRRRCV